MVLWDVGLLDWFSMVGPTEVVSAQHNGALLEENSSVLSISVQQKERGNKAMFKLSSMAGIVNRIQGRWQGDLQDAQVFEILKSLFVLRMLGPIKDGGRWYIPEGRICPRYTSGLWMYLEKGWVRIAYSWNVRLFGDQLRNMGQWEGQAHYQKPSWFSERTKDIDKPRKWSSWALGLWDFKREKKGARPPVLEDESEGQTFSGTTLKSSRIVTT